ncbi:unnamed protein product [Albugo candida]|uniref:Uncharacterized protein n=1 Tax=Albugo candida TaxID=65357 RepID=A0A024FYH6_9STRA|nr:unnamed protein product [Albugo candida]|eukprot:CCI11724.1 unnamed protein product [Albugo candida]
MISYIVDINTKTEGSTSTPEFFSGLADINYAGLFYKGQKLEIRFSPYLLQLPQEAYDATIKEIERNGYEIDHGIQYASAIRWNSFDMVMQVKLSSTGRNFRELPGTRYQVSHFKDLHTKPSDNGAWILTPVLMADFTISVDTRGGVKQYEIVAKA